MKEITNTNIGKKAVKFDMNDNKGINVRVTIDEDSVRYALEDAGYEPSDADIEDVIHEIDEQGLEEQMYSAAWRYIQMVADDILQEV